jgi:hypothetical protein
MKTNITSLVEEALKEMKRPVHIQYHQENLKKILTTLAEKASRNGLQPLPDVDTLMNDIYMNTATLGPIGSKDIAEYLHSKYGTPPAEWWMGLEKGDNIMDETGIKRTFTGTIFLETGIDVICDVSKCSPYTEATALEQFMQSLTPEQIELAKRLKIEEGEG